MSTINVSNLNLINTIGTNTDLTVTYLNATNVNTPIIIVPTSTIGALTATGITTTNLKSTNTTTNTCTITSLVATGITAGTLDASNFVGMIAPFATTTNSATFPTGWLYCTGGAVSRTTYSALYSVIGTTWGVGNGTTTFNVPDLKGAFLRGYGTGTINGRNKAGPNVGSRQEDQEQGHKHTLEGYYTTGGGSPSSEGWSYEQQIGDITDYRSTRVHEMTGPIDDNSGSYGTPRVGAETYPYNFGMNYFIKF
jgi:hypothetical protein